LVSRGYELFLGFVLLQLKYISSIDQVYHRSQKRFLDNILPLVSLRSPLLSGDDLDFIENKPFQQVALKHLLTKKGSDFHCFEICKLGHFFKPV
jgi:hypothetical protein